MTPKHMTFSSLNPILLFLLISLSVIEIESNLSLSRQEIESVCLNSDEYINNFFNGNEELPENYIELDKIEIERGNDENIIKLILLSENAETEYENEKIPKLKTYKIILLILVIFFIISIIFFEIHFLCRISCGNIEKIIQKKRENTFTCFTYFKIHPFGIFKYPCMEQEECDKFFIEYKSQNVIYNKKQIIFISFIIFVLMIGLIFLTVLIILDSNKAKITINNLTCTLMKFFYEIKSKPIRQSSFLGFENLNNLLINFDNYLEVVYEKIPTLTNKLNECKTQSTNWISLISEFQKKLSNQESMEFYLYGLPSDPANMKDDFSEMNDTSKAYKHLFQLEVIYKYYPVSTEGKNLYNINKFFNDLSEPIISEVEKLEKKVDTESSNNEKVEDNDIYRNVVSKFNNILNIYIEKFEEVYLEKIDIDLKNDLTKVCNIDLIFVFILVLSIILSIILIKNIFTKDCFLLNKIFSFLLMHFIFIFFILSIYQLTISQKIYKKMIYVQDIRRGITFLFESSNINYLNENPINNIVNIDLKINDNNLFYYLNYMINNKGKISDNPEIKLGPLSNEEVTKEGKTFNNLSNYLDSYNNNYPNEYLYNYIIKISQMIEGGLKSDTGFQDISGTGFLNTYREDPLTYLTYINLRTRITTRTDWGFKDFDCDETWNISTKDYGFWTYTNSEKYLCDNCTNHYSPKNADIPPLLNFLEFTLEQAIQRYSDLKNTKNNAEYNGIVYYLNAAQFFRNSSFLEHLQKMYNFNIKLNDIQKNNFASIKQTVNSAKEIINEYSKVLDSIVEGGNIYSGIYCEYLREDLDFVLGEVKNGLLIKVNHINKYHFLMDIVNIVLSFFMIIFYCLISYYLPYFPIEKDDVEGMKQQNDSSIKKIIDEKKIDGSILSHHEMVKNNQIILNISNNNSIDVKINQIETNKINNNFNNIEGEIGIKNENNGINLPINNSSKLSSSLLKSDHVKDNSNSMIHNERLVDGEEVDFASKTNIIGELQNNDGILKLNENKK